MFGAVFENVWICLLKCSARFLKKVAIVFENVSYSF
jgi:hypothetical protein